MIHIAIYCLFIYDHGQRYPYLPHVDVMVSLRDGVGFTEGPISQMVYDLMIGNL